MVGLASSLCLFSDDEDELDREREMDRVYDSESDDLEEWLNSDWESHDTLDSSSPEYFFVLDRSVSCVWLIKKN